MVEREWRQMLSTAHHYAKPLTDLSKIAADCFYFDGTLTDTQNNLIKSERSVDFHELELGHEGACVRLLLQPHQLARERFTDKAAESETVRRVDAAIGYIQTHICKKNGTDSYVGFDLLGVGNPEVAVYFDFNGPHAKADALELYAQIQSNIEQRKAGGRG